MNTAKSLIRTLLSIEHKRYRKGTSSGEEHVLEVWIFAKWELKIVLWCAG